MPRLRPAHGFSIIELLVSLAIVAIVSSQLLLVFQGQQKAYITNEHVLDVQEDARLVMSLLTQEARMAGFMISPVAGISAIDGGPANPDVLCLSDANIIDPVSLTNVSQPFERARLSAPVLVGNDFVDLVAGDRDIDNNLVDDIVVGQAIIIASIIGTTCAVVDNIVGNRLELDRVLNIAFGTDARVVPAVMYQVGAGGLTRNTLLMSAEVEDLQVEFGVDINGDGVILAADGEWPIDDLTGFNPSRILQVRLTVTTRSQQPDPDFAGGRDAAANRAAGAADNFRRRRFLTSVQPRNLN